MNQRRSRCLCRLMLLLAGASSFAAAGESPALPLPFETFGGTAWTIADFDGDGRPDVLTARPQLADHGFLHHISIQLSSGSGHTVYFSVKGSGSGIPGIHVVARDVDGDRDIDLVFTAAVSEEPIGVWLNHGHGIFNRASGPAAREFDSAAYSGTTRIQHP